MLQLASKLLPDETNAHLVSLQAKVDAAVDFAAKATKANLLWNGKTGSQKGKLAFEKIKATLTEMCVSVEICNYCEQNEANDIEHIYPKSLFPSMAFKWDNYLLACKQCNTNFKLDFFAVLDLNDDVFDIPRGTEPPNMNGAFINPRMENPSEFMMLNTGSFKFELLPSLDKKANNKATKTLEVLQLNERDQLVESRKAIARYHYLQMDLLVKILSANSIDELQALITPYDNRLDLTQPLIEIKKGIKDGFKKDI